MRLAACLLLAWTTAAAETSLEVKWKRALQPDKPGILRIGETGLAFLAEGKKARQISWPFEDIQIFDRLSRTEVEVRSYDDSRWRLGRDRRYRFTLQSGEFGDELHRHVTSRIGKPATDRVPQGPLSAELELPVKHLKLMGGSQGTLYVTSKQIVYSTDVQQRSRVWRLDRDVNGVWSSDPYRLEVHVFEGRERYMRQPTVYRFALKRPLDGEYYRRLKERLYGLERARSPGP